MNEYRLCKLSDEEFSEFALSLKCQNFFQSIYMKNVFVNEGKEVYLLGLKDTNNLVVCATLIVSSSKFLKYKTFECIKGYLIDFNNFYLVSIFTNKIIKFIKKRRAYRLIIDPYIPLIERDINGDVKKGINNTKVKKYLKSIGFREIDSAQVKWMFALDTNKSYEEVFKSFKSNTKNIINKTINKYNLVVEELSYNDLNIFKDITLDTCKRKKFKDRDLSYYQNIYKSFKDKVKVLVCKLNINKYLNNLINEKNKLLKSIDSTSNNKKINNYKKDISVIESKINDLKNIEVNNDYLILSASMFITYGREVVYLFSGSYEKYLNFNGQYLLQNVMIKYACDNNFDRYNFFGILCNFKDDGVYEFKKGFGGYVEELLGTYEIKVNFIYYVHNLLKLVKKYYKK